MSKGRGSTIGGYRWRGFELAPAGCLFEQLIDGEGEMGVAYERSLRFEKGLHVHDRLLLVFSREGSTMRVTSPEPSPREFVVTRDDVLAVPAGELHDDHWITEVYDTFALLPSNALLARVTERLGERARLADLFAVSRLFKRMPFLAALVDEYFGDRVLRGLATGPRNAALEELIVVEIVRLAAEALAAEKANELRTPPAERPGPSSVVARSLRQLEANLFSELDLDALARAAGASRSSLLRYFRRELDTTPKAYLLGRRLDEGRRLLGAGRHSVGEVAQLVGYASLGSFSEAFRRRFGVPPSEVGKKNVT